MLMLVMEDTLSTDLVKYSDLKNYTFCFETEILSTIILICQKSDASINSEDSLACQQQ